MSKFMKYIFTKYTVTLYFLALLIMGLSNLLSNAISSKPIADFLLIFGSGIFITTLVSSILNFYFQQDIHRYFSIIKGAESASIIKIYENRSHAMPDIETEMQRRRSNNVEFLAVSGTTYFHPHCKIMDELNQLCVNDANIHIRVLLLDPRSKHAIERSIIEEGIKLDNIHDITEIDYPNKKLCQDILLSFRQLEGILDEAVNKNNFKLEIRTYDTAPILDIAHINNISFIEQYHYGVSEEERHTTLIKCLGKKVPVLAILGNSIPGKIWLSHFNYLWVNGERRKVVPGFTTSMLHLLEGPNQTWVNVFNETQHITNEFIQGV
jgi:hypothetical protein